MPYDYDPAALERFFKKRPRLVAKGIAWVTSTGGSGGHPRDLSGVAEWIDREKLSQSSEDDVDALVNLGVITYLTQLLEFGFFHGEFARGGGS